jgi:ribosomal protein S18 acetylase RimI-like enzyme
MDFTVRRVQPDDGPRLAEIRLRALADAPEAFATTYAEAAQRTAEDWSEQAAARADGTRQVTYFAERDDVPIAMVGAFVGADPSVADLVGLWVAPEGRRHGVARTLIEMVMAWAREGGVAQVELWVADGNEAAYRLYESAGFLAVPGDPTAEGLRPSDRRMARIC